MNSVLDYFQGSFYPFNTAITTVRMYALIKERLRRVLAAIVV